MTGVIIAADESDKKMWKQLPDILCRNFPSVFASRHGASSVSANPEIAICDLESAVNIQSDNLIVIFKDVVEYSAILPRNKQIVAIVDSANEQLIQFVSDTRLPAITCGLSARDTLTLTSINTDNAVLGIQRTITSFHGDSIEPQEIPISLTAPIDSYTLMAATSVFLLPGEIARLGGAFL